MDFTINSYQFGERPDVIRPDPEFFKQLGEEGIRKMVSKHYDLLRQSPIKKLFPADKDELEKAKQNSADFMIQICGGPDYFNQHRGTPRMAARHAPFTITPEGRIVWLNCYKQALQELTIPQKLILSFWNYINVFSNWMVNAPSGQYKIDNK